MRVNDVATELWRLIDGGEVSNDSKWVFTDVKLAVQQTAAKLIQTEFSQNYSQYGESIINTNYIEWFETNEVKYDELRDYYYIDLPTDILSLPNDYGVQFCGQTKNLNTPFTRTTVGTTNFYSSLLPDDVPSFMVTADKLEFVRFNPLIKNIVLAVIPALPNEINAIQTNKCKYTLVFD